MIELVWAWSGDRIRRSHLWAGRWHEGKRAALCGALMQQTGDDVAASRLDCVKCIRIAASRYIELPAIWLDPPDPGKRGRLENDTGI